MGERELCLTLRHSLSSVPIKVQFCSSVQLGWGVGVGVGLGLGVALGGGGHRHPATRWSGTRAAAAPDKRACQRRRVVPKDQPPRGAPKSCDPGRRHLTVVN